MNRLIILAIAAVIIITAGIFSYMHLIHPLVFMAIVLITVRICARAGYIFNKKGIK